MENNRPECGTEPKSPNLGKKVKLPIVLPKLEICKVVLTPKALELIERSEKKDKLKLLGKELDPAHRRAVRAP
jgi:hypothetical protein